MCANCPVLRDRILRLERELNLRHRDGEIATLMRHFDISSSAARILSALYHAKGHTVTFERLIENASLASQGVLSAMVYRIRAATPEGAVEMYRRVGYCLSPIGMSAVLAALQPVEIQDVRAA